MTSTLGLLTFSLNQDELSVLLARLTHIVRILKFIQSLLVPVIALSLPGCSYKVAAPPGKFISCDGPEVLSEGDKTIAFEAGSHFEFLGPGIRTISADYSKGLGGGREFSIRPFAGEVNPNLDTLSASPLIGGFSLGLKTKIPNRKYMAYYINGGWLYSHYATILSAHAGIISGYEEDSRVPFLAAEVYTASPIRKLPIPGDEDVDPQEVTPPTYTYGFKGVAGIKFKLRPKVSAAVACGFAYARSMTHSLKMLHLGANIEYQL